MKFIHINYFPGKGYAATLHNKETWSTEGQVGEFRETQEKAIDSVYEEHLDTPWAEDVRILYDLGLTPRDGKIKWEKKEIKVEYKIEKFAKGFILSWYSENGYQNIAIDKKKTKKDIERAILNKEKELAALRYSIGVLEQFARDKNITLND